MRPEHQPRAGPVLLADRFRPGPAQDRRQRRAQRPHLLRVEQTPEQQVPDLPVTPELFLVQPHRCIILVRMTHREPNR